MNQKMGTKREEAIGAVGSGKLWVCLTLRALNDDVVGGLVRVTFIWGGGLHHLFEGSQGLARSSFFWE